MVHIGERRLGRKTYIWVSCPLCNKHRWVRKDSPASKPCHECSNINRRNSGNSRWKGYKSISGSYFRSLKNSAKTRGIEFSITIQDLYTQWVKQEGKCHFTRMALKQTENTVSRQGTASVDRRDSSKGYTQENIVWVHKHINRMKNDLPIDKFVGYCKAVASNCIEVNMVEGKLSRTFTKPWTAPDGRKLILHSFKLEEFSDEFFRTGTKALGIKEGTIIRFTPDEKGNVKPENVEIVQVNPKPAEQAAPAAKAAAAPASLTKESYWDRKEAGDVERQKAITYQAARKDALELVALALGSNALPLPEDNTERLGVLTAAVDAYTLRFVEDTSRLSPPEKSEPPAAAKPKRGRPKKAPEGEEVDLG